MIFKERNTQYILILEVYIISIKSKVLIPAHIKTSIIVIFLWYEFICDHYNLG